MRALLQRVNSASVSVQGETVAEISRGVLVFLGVFPEDTGEVAGWLADKTLGLRIFPDYDKPMNASVMDVAGELLIVSQFTLAADTSRGKRPGFSTAAAPELAEKLYSDFVAAVRDRYPRVQTGRFGADMQVALVNDGPVTFLLER
ncbi:MAG: D-tyrosyl-tRNA(Tyr) deacylase [Gammaproteobacteria bacterium]|nr:D-tyrosyl-tRNA(Tyr) deacylase [Gammaproteobacteria bacterium]|tara:strand:- start:39484 stop:39921 length:438 start_codon:yes stop_codon:yes gene_type:complete